MLRISLSLVGKVVYVGQRIPLPGTGGLRARISDIWSGPIRRRAAVVSVHSTVFYRSQSAKVYLFIQLSSESWSFDNDGSLFAEKAVGLFLPELFQRWRDGGTNHVVSIVLFSRVFYNSHEIDQLRDHDLLKDGEGRSYRDFYQSILDLELVPDWQEMLSIVKRESASIDVIRVSRTQSSSFRSVLYLAVGLERTATWPARSRLLTMATSSKRSILLSTPSQGPTW